MIVSGSATALSLADTSAGTGLDAGPLTELHLALSTFSSAAYGRGGLNDSDLDEALEQGERGTRQVARHFTGLARASRAARHSVLGTWDKVWAR